jgi:rubrerythrin
MFIAITIATLFFAFKTARLRSKKELQEERMEIIDKHFNEMIRIECPYCKTLYDVNRPECPNCKAPTKKILFPPV